MTSRGSPTSADGSRTLTKLAGTYAVGRLVPQAPLPDQPPGQFFALVRTETELSVVVSEPVPPIDSARWQSSFVNFQVEGPLDFSLVGIIADLTAPLASANVPVFVVSSFDTDYVLIPLAEEDKAVSEWRRAGWRVVHN